MEAATAVHGLHVCASYEIVRQQRLRSNSLAGTRQEHVTSSSLKALRQRLPARCLYCPPVEALGASRFRPVGEQNVPFSSPSLALLKPELEAPAEQVIVQQENPRINDEDIMGADRFEDEIVPAPQDPVFAAHGDATTALKASEGGRDLELRRPGRFQPQTASLSQGFRAAGNRGMSYAIGAAGRPAANASKLGGPAGLMMGLAVAGVGIATALQKAVEVQPLPKLCTRCDGYGVECCDVCEGVGTISWEGKAHRKNVCPRCFGSLVKKCPRCDGCRSRKDGSPLLQKLKSTPKSSSSNK